jgi:hypothetical protein
MTDFAASIGRLRAAAQGIGDAVSTTADSPWYPLTDTDFWNCVDLIEQSGQSRDSGKADFLASFVLIDDLGPLGRGMLLAKAALLALSEMPEASSAVVRALPTDFAERARTYKIGICKLTDVAGIPAPALLAVLLADEDPVIRQRAGLLGPRQEPR